MSIGKEFKEFALKGNVLDLAVGVIIGAAFGTVVKSFTEDILMPPLALLTGHSDFSNKFIALGGGHFDTLAQAKAAGVPTMNYGLFINAIIDFMLVAFAVFMIVKWFNKLRREPEAAPPNVRDCPECLSQIPKAARRCKFCSATV